MADDEFRRGPGIAFRASPLNADLLNALKHPLLLDVGVNASSSDLDSYVSRLGIDEQRASTAYVFRLKVGQVESLLQADSQDETSELLRRAPKVPLFVLTLRNDHELYRIDACGVARLPEVDEMGALAILRSVDLHAVVDEAKDACFLKASSTQHFVAPSGEHCEAFFRLGDALRSKSALDRMAFWITPALAAAAAVVVDNWSISALALRSFQQTGKQVPFDCLSSHPERNRRDAERVISPMIEHVRSTGGLLFFLVSVTSTGSFARIVREIVNDRLPTDRIRIVALFGLAGTPEHVERLCTLDFEPKNYAPEACPLCKSEKSRPIPLDPSLYYLKALPESPVTLRKKHFEDRKFIDRFGAAPGVLSLHRDDRFRKHHAFFVDFAAMMTGDEALAGECEAAIAKLPGEWDLVVTPTKGTSLLGDMAASQLGVARIAFDTPRLLTQPDIDRMNGARRILIVDDVLITGLRIEECVKMLREKVTCPDAVAILVGLARPTSAQALDRHRIAWTTNLPWAASFSYVLRSCLPDWQSLNCPWCEELDVLSGAAEGVAQPPDWITQRIGRLTEREQGMQVEPMLLLPGAMEPRLGHGSLAANEGASALASLFSVASALQFLRHDANDIHRLYPHFPMHQVMASRNLSNFSENLLRAIFLRVVAPGEWGMVEQQKLSTLLREVISTDQKATVLSGEVVLAALRGSLDRGLIAPVYPIIERRHPEANILALATAIETATPANHRVQVLASERRSGSTLIWLFLFVAVALLLWLWN